MLPVPMMAARRVGMIGRREVRGGRLKVKIKLAVTRDGQ
jgi:hypothetical protein